MLRYTWITFVVILLDQLTKLAAENLLTLYSPVAVFPGFNFTLVYNTGAAFSFLSDAGGWQRILFVFLSTAISIFLFFWLRQIVRDEEQRHNQMLQIAISLILGGAIGNLIDRAMTGEVVDFIQVYYSTYYFPAFNIADSAITLGAGLLILDMFLETKRQKKKES